jgi:hypothetical protein
MQNQQKTRGNPNWTQAQSEIEIRLAHSTVAGQGVSSKATWPSTPVVSPITKSKILARLASCHRVLLHVRGPKVEGNEHE